MFQIERTSFDTLLVNKALIFFLLLLRGCRLHIAGELFQSHNHNESISYVLNQQLSILKKFKTQNQNTLLTIG